MKPTPAQEARAAHATELRQITIDDYLASIPEAARGKTCEAEDTPRLNEQGLRVYNAMRDLRVHTLADLAAATGDPEASVSARIREIRRYLREGNKGDVIRERVPGGNGLHTYAMKLNRYHGAA